MVRTSRGGRGVRECADSQALRQSVGRCGAQNELMADIWRCPPSLSPLSLHAQIHMHALQHSLPLFPLASPSCLLLWPDEPSLFICYYTGIVRSKNQEGACLCASAVGWGAAWAATKTLLSTTLSASIDHHRWDTRNLRSPSVSVFLLAAN